MGITGVVLGALVASFPVTVLLQGFVLGRTLGILNARLLRATALFVAKALVAGGDRFRPAGLLASEDDLTGVYILNVGLYAAFVAACDLIFDRDCRTLIRHLVFRKAA